MSTIVNKPLAPQFGSGEQAAASARLGMWLFLAGELLLFGAVFVACMYVKAVYPETWGAAAQQLDLLIGSANTVLLVTAAAAAAVAVRTAKVNVSGEHNTRIAGLILVAMVLSAAFLGATFMDYAQKMEAGLVPGAAYAFQGIEAAQPQMFFAAFFLGTGVHALHVAVGLLVLTWCLLRAIKGGFHRDQHAGLENGAAFVQLLTVVWFFLFPLLYLV